MCTGSLSHRLYVCVVSIQSGTNIIAEMHIYNTAAKSNANIHWKRVGEQKHKYADASKIRTIICQLYDYDDEHRRFVVLVV